MLRDEDDRDDFVAVDEEQDLEELEEGEEELGALDGSREQPVAPSTEDEESDQASLEELLAQRTAKRGVEDFDDPSEILALRPEPEPPPAEPLPRKVAPIRERQEFVCKRCHLVKPRVQLADESRWLCRDCV